MVFVDYGNGEVKKYNEIVELPPGMQVINYHAQRYVLYGLKPIHTDPNSIGFMQVGNAI